MTGDEGASRFEAELAAFSEDREAFREVVAGLASRGEAVLGHSERLTERSDALVSDLEGLKAEITRLRDEMTTRIEAAFQRVETLSAEANAAVEAAGQAISDLRDQAQEDVSEIGERARGEVDTLLADAQEAHEKVLSRAHADYSSLILKTRAEHDEALARSRFDYEALLAEARTEFGSLRDAVAALERGISGRLEAVEAHSAELGERMDAANVGLLQASADLAELLDRFDELQQVESAVQAQVDRGARAVARVAGRTKALSQLRAAVALLAVLLGVALAGIGGALGLAAGLPVPGWIAGGVAWLSCLGLGAWVLLSGAHAPGRPAPRMRPEALPVLPAPDPVEVEPGSAPGELEPAGP